MDHEFVLSQTVKTISTVHFSDFNICFIYFINKVESDSKYIYLRRGRFVSKK